MVSFEAFPGRGFESFMDSGLEARGHRGGAVLIWDAIESTGHSFGGANQYPVDGMHASLAVFYSEQLGFPTTHIKSNAEWNEYIAGGGRLSDFALIFIPAPRPDSLPPIWGELFTTGRRSYSGRVVLAWEWYSPDYDYHWYIGRGSVLAAAPWTGATFIGDYANSSAPAYTHGTPGTTELTAGVEYVWHAHTGLAEEYTGVWGRGSLEPVAFHPQPTIGRHYDPWPAGSILPFITRRVQYTTDEDGLIVQAPVDFVVSGDTDMFGGNDIRWSYPSGSFDERSPQAFTENASFMRNLAIKPVKLPG